MHRRRFIYMMVSILVAAFVLSLGSGQVLAQNPNPPPPTGGGGAVNSSDRVTTDQRVNAAARSETIGLQQPAFGTAQMAEPGSQPHYYGPYPNYANSPLRLADAVVTFNSTTGTGAEAVATVDLLTGAITAIDVINPGSGYRAATTVEITSPIAHGSGAIATATIDYSGIVDSVTLDTPGSGYTAPAVAFSGGGGSGASATAYGAVDAFQVQNGGSGYTTPVVDVTGGGGMGSTGTAVVSGGVIVSITVDAPGLDYTSAPTVTITDPNPNAGGAVATATLSLTKITVDNFGTSFESAPLVEITDSAGTGSGATATAHAVIGSGAVTGVTVTNGGSGYVTPGIRKFINTLPLLTPAGANDLGQYIPVAVADTTSYPGADYYEIAVVEYEEQMHSDLPPTKLRGYVQLETSVIQGGHYTLPGGYLGVDKPHYLGPVIVASKDKPVRILFRNLLPTGQAGNLFIPVDTTVMGSGMGPGMGGMGEMDPQHPMCGELPKPMDCYPENRATLHLHGGISPWISDGTPHQWITPANEDTPYPEGVSVTNVPDMPDPGPGAMTFFYTNQQSARLMFYHDHAWGITRLNVYAGEAAGYIITDETEQSLIGQGLIPAAQETIPLIIQDKTFVPITEQLAMQDPTWDLSRWGGFGDLWVPHVYVPAQNPGDSSGVNQFGRWAYGPWFWPPTSNIDYPPVDNIYHQPACDLDPADPGYAACTEPWESPQIPGVPFVSMGMEAFNDTPMVNGTVYPTITLEPKTYRLRILSAANDRFFNLSLYQADASGTEVALNAAEVAAALEDPAGVFPTPDVTLSPPGPNWIQIGTEGGFLPAPVVIPAQPITWVTDPTVFNAGNVDKHSLLLGPAERADVIVDFSAFAGQTLILYNDAPAAFPARDPRYDYYTGNPDLTDTGGAPSTPPGYGPNTRTVMQIKISAGPGADPYNLGALQTAFKATGLGGQGVFENSQNPIIVGQAAYNSAYGTNFRAAAPRDGFVRITDFTFKFNTLLTGNTTNVLNFPLQPKAIQDEMGEAFEKEYGRMSGNLGLEAPGAQAGAQNLILYPYVNPASEVIDGIELPVGTLEVTPIASADDGTQIWKITHNGVDTHPIHFHLYDVQLINRVGWDGIIRKPDANELGWKDTVRISPLEDTIVALRAIIPKSPFGVPDSVREYNPMMPLGSTTMFNNMDANGDPITPPIANQIVNFLWEYVWHCHILSHEEMDMMRPVSVMVSKALAAPPLLSLTEIGSGVELNWSDGTPVNLLDPAGWGDPSAEVGYRIERATGKNGSFETIGTALANVTGPFVDNALAPNTTYKYRVVAFNAAGDSFSNEVILEPLPLAPSGLSANALSSTQVDLSWTDNSGSEVGFRIERCLGTNCLDFAPLGQTGANANSFSDTSAQPNTTYAYRVYAYNDAGNSDYSNTAEATTPMLPPAAPSGLNGAAVSSTRIDLSWTDNAGDEDGFVIEICQGAGCTNFAEVGQVGANVAAFSATNLTSNTLYRFRVYAVNTAGPSDFSNIVDVTTPGVGPTAPTNLTLTQTTQTRIRLNWRDSANNEQGFYIERLNGTIWTRIATVGANVVSYVNTNLTPGATYTYRVQAYNAGGVSAYTNEASLTLSGPPAAPTSLRATNVTRNSVSLAWNDNSTNETSFQIQRRLAGGNWANIATLGPNVTTYTSTGLTGNRTYEFRVRARNAIGNSAWSNTLRVTTPQ